MTEIVAPPSAPRELLSVVQQMNRALQARDNPKSPQRLPVFAIADLPSPAAFKNCVALLDTGALASSDGSAWLLADGSPV